MSMTCLPAIILVFLATLTSACNSKPDSPAAGDIDVHESVNLAAAAREVAEGIRCNHLLAAVIEAKRGPLRRVIAQEGLDGVDRQLAHRWEARVRHDARRAGLSEAELSQWTHGQRLEIADAATLKAHAADIKECAATASRPNER